MSFSRAFQWYHSHLDPIWPDGTFKTGLRNVNNAKRILISWAQEPQFLLGIVLDLAELFGSACKAVCDAEKSEGCRGPWLFNLTSLLLSMYIKSLADLTANEKQHLAISCNSNGHLPLPETPMSPSFTGISSPWSWSSANEKPHWALSSFLLHAASHV